MPKMCHVSALLSQEAKKELNSTGAGGGVIRPEGKELHVWSRAKPFPESGLFLSYCSMCIDFTPLWECTENRSRNPRLQTRDICWQLHHLFPPVLSRKRIAIFSPAAIPGCLSDFALSLCLSPFQPSTKIYITALFRICITSLSIRHTTCLAIVYYWNITWAGFRSRLLSVHNNYGWKWEKKTKRLEN